MPLQLCETLWMALSTVPQLNINGLNGWKMGGRKLLRDLKACQTLLRVSCVFLRCVTMHQDMISTFLMMFILDVEKSACL